MTMSDNHSKTGGKSWTPSGERRSYALERRARSNAPCRTAGRIPGRARRRFSVMLLMCILTLSAVFGQAPAASFQEYQLKAVFLYNFVNFVTWPDEAFGAPDRPFAIGILGEDPFGSFLEKVVADETFKGRTILLKRGDSPDELADCQILFISASNRSRLDSILESLRSRHTLTVGDFDGFIEAGGMINLIHAGQRVRIEINVQTTRNADLGVSSKLLRVAKVVD